MAKIDWGQIAGTVLGGVSNLIIPNSGTVVANLVDKGVDMGVDITNKIRLAKESGQTEDQIAKSLANSEAAQFATFIDDSAKTYQDTYNSYLALMTEGDKVVSTARKKAKMTQTSVPYDSKTVAGVQRSQLNVFAKWPDQYTFTEFAADQGADLGYFAETTASGTTSTGAATTGGSGNQISGVDEKSVSGRVKIDYLAAGVGVGLIFLALSKNPFGFITAGMRKRKSRTAKARAALARKRSLNKSINRKKN